MLIVKPTVTFDKFINMVIFLKNRKESGDPYEKHFRSLNYDTQFVPLLEHEPVNSEELLTFLRSAEFAAADAIIITSQRAIEAVVTHLESLTDEERVTLQSKPIYTVGPATAHELSANGFTDIRGAEHAGNGGALADIILQEKCQTFVFFTGEVRRDIIPKKLREANRQLEEKIVYKTSSKSDISTKFLDAMNTNTDPWLVFFSPSGTEQILKILKENCHQSSIDASDVKLACIGPTTRDFLVNQGFKPDAVAAKPDAVSLAEAITKTQQHETQSK
jgi:uroporphyrinogen-III synthase